MPVRSPQRQLLSLVGNRLITVNSTIKSLNIVFQEIFAYFPFVQGSVALHLRSLRPWVSLQGIRKDNLLFRRGCHWWSDGILSSQLFLSQLRNPRCGWSNINLHYPFHWGMFGKGSNRIIFVIAHDSICRLPQCRRVINTQLWMIVLRRWILWLLPTFHCQAMETFL